MVCGVASGGTQLLFRFPSKLLKPTLRSSKIGCCNGGCSGKSLASLATTFLSITGPQTLGSTQYVPKHLNDIVSLYPSFALPYGDRLELDLAFRVGMWGTLKLALRWELSVSQTSRIGRMMGEGGRGDWQDKQSILWSCSERGERQMQERGPGESMRRKSTFFCMEQPPSNDTEHRQPAFCSRILDNSWIFLRPFRVKFKMMT